MWLLSGLVGVALVGSIFMVGGETEEEVLTDTTSSDEGSSVDRDTAQEIAERGDLLADIDLREDTDLELSEDAETKSEEMPPDASEMASLAESLASYLSNAGADVFELRLDPGPEQILPTEDIEAFFAETDSAEDDSTMGTFLAAMPWQRAPSANSTGTDASDTGTDPEPGQETAQNETFLGEDGGTL